MSMTLTLVGGGARCWGSRREVGGGWMARRGPFKEGRTCHTLGRKTSKSHVPL